MKAENRQPHADSESARKPESPNAELLGHRPFVVDRDGLLCGSELILNHVCFETGVPVSGTKDHVMKLFAPTGAWDPAFRAFHWLILPVALLLVVVVGRVRSGRLDGAAFLALVLLAALFGLSLWAVGKVRHVRIHFRRSTKGDRIHFRKVTLPVLAFGMVFLVPSTILLPWVFRQSFWSGLLSCCIISGLLILFRAFFRDPQAVVLPNGKFRISGLSPDLMAALRTSENVAGN